MRERYSIDEHGARGTDILGDATSEDVQQCGLAAAWWSGRRSKEQRVRCSELMVAQTSERTNDWLVDW